MFEPKEGVLYDGEKVKIGTQEVVVPPLSLGSMRAYAERIKGMNLEKLDEETVGLSIELIHASLRRNYPSLTVEDVANEVDISQMGKAVTAVMHVSGFKEAQPGE